MSAVGCDYHFELDNIVEDPLICIRSYMPAGDSAVIRLNKTVPVTVIGKIDTTLVSPSYSLKCNGREMELDETWSDNGCLHIKTGGFRSGDRLEITATAEGMEPASASTIVPDRFPDYSVKTFQDEKGNSIAEIHIDEMPENGNFYGAAIEFYADIEYKDDEGEPYKIDGYVFVDFNDEEIPLDYNGYYPYYIYREDKEVVLWSEKDMTEGAYRIRMDFRRNMNNYDNKRIERYIRVHLLRFSEEMYRTLYAEAAMDNFLASLGFSSPSFTYNSIDNGTGYFGAYSYTCSDWILERIWEK